MKSGKEIIILNKNENFKVRCGAIKNYKSPVSIYVKITSWLKVVNEVDDLNQILKEYRLKLRTYLKNSDIVLKNFDYNTIINVEISHSRVKMDAPTFFKLEFNFYQKDSNNLLPLVHPKRKPMPNLKEIVEKLSNDVLDLELFNEHSNFRYQATKIKKC